MWAGYKGLVLAILTIILGSTSVLGQQSQPPPAKPDNPKLSVPRIPAPPLIDGVLDDPVWQQPPQPLGDWLTYNPLYGEKLAQRTAVWIAYDANYLYFAFRCLDPEPSKIKTSISRRDRLWNDDWVGLSLDSMGNSQSSYDMFINPDGIQGDILTSSTKGEDLAPDWVWDSAGRLTEEGYNVEMRVPLKSIRFKSGPEVRMGVLFWRRISRLGMSASWPDLPPGQFVFGRHATLLLENLKQPLTLELIPNATYSIHQTRATPDRFVRAESKPDAGLSVKYGLTSAVTLDGTINPDFSQVESDAFQVEVNQRFPVFFNEKRPFFMEGMGTFELAGAYGDGNMRTAVHTRRIVDPIFGLKLTGTMGNITFATLSASDQAPGRVLGDSASNPYRNDDKLFNVGRVLYNLGRGSYVGALVTDTEFVKGHNRVVAGDVSLRKGEHQQFSATFIGSNTLPIDGKDAQTGMAGQAAYSYNTKRYAFISQLEHYDKDFRMDTAFYNRTGITAGWSFGAVSFYPDAKKYGWFKRFVPFVFSQYGRDRIQDGNELFALAGVRMHFTKQGFFRTDFGRGREPWAGRTFDTRLARVMGGGQLTRWLNIFSQTSFSRAIFYDPSNPFSGDQRSYFVSLIMQPSTKLNQTVQFNRVKFDRASSGERVYSVNIVNTRTTYQFSEHFFLRAIMQFDSSRHRLLSDFLGSWELLPGTVAYAGYGSLLEKREWNGSEWLGGTGDYLTTRRGFFFKASYLHRF